MFDLLYHWENKCISPSFREKNSCISVVQQISGFIYIYKALYCCSHKCQTIGPYFLYKPIP